MEKKKKSGFKRTLRKIGNWFVSLKNNFFKLKKHVRYIIYVWAIVILVLLLLVACTNINSKKIDKYQKMETELKTATLTYVMRNEIYPNVSNKWTITLEELKEMHYISDKEIPDNSCKGFSVVYYNENQEDYVVNSYINCKHYTSKNYLEEKEQ